MRSRVLRFLARVARSAEEAGDAAAAAEGFQRFIEVDELNESLHRQLMLCFQRSGALSQGLAVYERLRALLAARSKLMPSPETQALYANMKASA
jgi:DNA-binding SARP family transcriptional activator